MMIRTHTAIDSEPTGYTETCTRCKGRGTRWFHIATQRTQQPCKPCGGTGERTYAASAEQRARTRDVAKARKARKLAEAIAEFAATYQQVYQWIMTREFTFAVSLRAALHKWGSLTDKQLAAAIRAERMHG